MTDSLLRMTGIGKSFSGVRVLNNVHFDLKPGEVHVLAGENGAGKSTLMKILAGVHTEYDGEIELEGRTVRLNSPHHASRLGIAVIHQEMSLVGAMNTVDNIFLGRETHGCGGWLNGSSQRENAARLMDRMGLTIDLDQAVEELPLSIRQMIEIAKALVFHSRILVMDEPTSGLNQPEVERLFSLIADLKAQGRGIIYISHRMEEIYRLADRITVLRDGALVGTSNAKVLPVEELIEWMVGRKEAAQFPLRKATLGPERIRVDGLHIPDPTGARPWAVENASFTVCAGEILGVAGLSGSGNSDLLNGIFGTYGPIPKGSILLGGAPFAVCSPSHSISRGLALVTNDRKETGLIPEMDIVKNVTLASLNKVSPAGWLDLAAERGMTDYYTRELSIRAFSIFQNVSTLSGGNQQKVVLAKWLETQPKVLMLDEPTRGVDVRAKHEIYELMNELTRNGMAIILITSEMPEFLALSDRIIVLHRGRITARLTRREARPENVLQAAMGQTLNHEN